MKETILSHHYVILISVSAFLGTLARVLTLKADYRQYPSHPNGYLIHLVTGFIAAAMGAVAIPAIMTKNFTAVTFLSLAIQQFRDVRKTEKDSLKSLENTEYTYRGDAYIDGIAKTFEARNYFSLIVAFVVGLTMEIIPDRIIFVNILSGTVAGMIVFYILKHFSKGKSVGDIANVKIGNVEVKESELYVDGIYVTNLLGTENARKLVSEECMAAVIYAKEDHYRIALDNYGQRQAIIFEVTRALGVKRYNFTRKEYEQGRIVVALVPIIKDEGALIEAIKKAPILESVKKSHKLMNNYTLNIKKE